MGRGWEHQIVRLQPARSDARTRGATDTEANTVQFSTARCREAWLRQNASTFGHLNDFARFSATDGATDRNPRHESHLVVKSPRTLGSSVTLRRNGGLVLPARGQAGSNRDNLCKKIG
jgi:hypothetical protein